MKESWRDKEARKIIESLNKMNLGPEYEPIKQLYKYLKQWKTDGERIEIDINFPEINKKFEGILRRYENQHTYIKLIHLNTNST